ncbi:hypothetical protein B5F74_09520 [Collinsella sp. An271]|nr:hypothetical protein B5F74_09520 [Collinsella sp. An271]
MWISTNKYESKYVLEFDRIKEMRFSIIVPVYNVEKYLQDCIESILEQSVEDVEIILVNDGSTDSSGLICRDYMLNYPERIKLVEQRNLGPYLARRAGYELASGDYLLTLDGDDTLRPDALELITQTLSQYDVDIILFGISRRSDYSSFWSEEPFSQSTYIPKDELSLIYKIACTSGALNSMCTKAFKKTLLDIDKDHSDMSGFSYAEDLFQSLAIIDRASSFYYLHEPLYFYRVNYDSSTKTFDRTQLEQRNFTWRQHLRFARKWDSDCGTSDFENGVYALGQRTYAEVSQAASESLPYPEAKAYLNDITDTPAYATVFSDTSKRYALRFDFRLLIFLLRRRHFLALYLICRIKRMVRRLLGR